MYTDWGENICYQADLWTSPAHRLFPHPAHSAWLLALTQIICRTVLRTVSSYLFSFIVPILFFKEKLNIQLNTSNNLGENFFF